MSNYGILTDYKQNELPFDNVNGFDGKIEYDRNGYLTKLLISSYRIDPIFQNDCKNIFINENIIGVKCKYSSAPVKTKERSQTKSMLDYSDRHWPHTSNIVDFVRCSVVFNTPKDLLTLRVLAYPFAYPFCYLPYKTIYCNIKSNQYQNHV